MGGIFLFPPPPHLYLEASKKCKATVKPVLSGHSKRRPKLVFKTDYSLMQVKSIVEHSAILSTFIKLPFVIKIFVLSLFEWPHKTGFTVCPIVNSFHL